MAANIINKVLRRNQSRVDEERFTLWTEPWAWRSEDGVYIGHNGDAWYYQKLRLSPMQWEDRDARVGITKQLSNLLADIGSRSKASVTGLQQMANKREVHLVSLTWWDLLSPPRENAEALRNYQHNAFGAMDVPNRMLLVGVKLERDSIVSKATEKKGTDSSIFNQMVKLARQSTGDDVPDVRKFKKDLDDIKSICDRYQTDTLTRDEYNQFESWFNQGRGVDALIDEHPKHLHMNETNEDLEISAVRKFDRPRMTPAVDQWILDALSHPGDAPHAVSIRAKLEPVEVTRQRSRRAQRRIEANIEEEEKSGDLEKRELSATHQLARDFEDYITNETSPMLSEVSFLFAREISEETETYLNFLELAYGVVLKPLEHRQMGALEEFAPCGLTRMNPFLQDVNIPLVASAGLQSFSELGEDAGAFCGIVDPDGTPLFIDPRYTSRNNLPPVFGVFGDPGSGKTFFAQNFGTQGVLGGEAVFFINPKGGSSLYGMCDYLNLQGDDSTTATRMSMSSLEKTPGAFDPFRFAKSREEAAEIAARHLLAPLDTPGQRMDNKMRLSLESGLKYGAQAGADCVWDALQYISNEEHRKELTNLIQQQMDASSIYAMGIAKSPRPRLTMAAHLNLVDFDRDIGLPTPNLTPSEYSAQEWIAVATISLVTKAAIEILLANKGGMLFLDEAWTFLRLPEAAGTLDKLAREGRSQGIVPVFLTQQIKDVVTKELAGYMSRVLVLKLQDKVEAKAALEICGLEPTQERLDWLLSAGPAPAKYNDDGEIEEEAKWAAGIFRDPMTRHAAVALGPTPDDAMQAWSTNPDDVDRRQAALKARGLDPAGYKIDGSDDDTESDSNEVLLGKMAPGTAIPVKVDKGKEVPGTPPANEQNPPETTPSVEPAAVEETPQFKFAAPPKFNAPEQFTPPPAPVTMPEPEEPDEGGNREPNRTHPEPSAPPSFAPPSKNEAEPEEPAFEQPVPFWEQIPDRQ